MSMRFSESTKKKDAISKDAAAAKAAKMSYGKYKALQFERGERRITPGKEKVPADVKVCPVCGCLFFPRHKNTRYCGEWCKATAHEAQRAERRKAEK